MATKPIFIIVTNTWPGDIIAIYEDADVAEKALEEPNRKIVVRTLILKQQSDSEPETCMECGLDVPGPHPHKE